MRGLTPCFVIVLAILEACSKVGAPKPTGLSEIELIRPVDLDFDISLVKLIQKESGHEDVKGFLPGQPMRVSNLASGVNYRLELSYMKDNEVILSSEYCSQPTQQSLIQSFDAGLTKVSVQVCEEQTLVVKNEARDQVNDVGAEPEETPQLESESQKTAIELKNTSSEESSSKPESLIDTQEGEEEFLGYLVKGNKIYKNGEKISLKGINWFGFDTGSLKPHGTWEGRSYDQYLSEIKGVGFNALRIPVSPEAINEQTELRLFLGKANEYGFHVLIDIHNCSIDDGHLSPTPCDNTIPSLESLASLILPLDNVVGIDVFNEPYGYTWAQWKDFVETAAAAIHRIRPETLIFAEGIGTEGLNVCQSYPAENDQCSHAPFWGENLSFMDTDPINVAKDKLVLAPHAYGPAVYGGQVYFNVDQFPWNLPAIWENNFGKLANDYPIAIGEFGGTLEGRDFMWQKSFVDYLVSKDIEYFFYWSLNPNSGDTGGIYYDDWRTFNWEKLKVLEPLLKR